VHSELGPPVQKLGYDGVEGSWNTMPEIAAIAKNKITAWATERKVLVILTQNKQPISEMADWVRSLGFSTRIGGAGVIDIGPTHLRIDLLSFQQRCRGFDLRRV
jgi:hypothetical protein